MISPYVRRLRLGAEVRALRAEAGLTADQLGKRIGRSRADISRLENGHVVDQADVIGILDTLGVDGDRWTKIVTIAREAGEKGWWESNKTMGDRQTLYANLEAGAATIREYQQTFFPGLLQIPEFVKARCESDATLEPANAAADGDGVVAGNAGRQRMLRRPGGPTLEVIIDEVAIHRLTAAPEIVKKQLYHLTTMVNSDRKVSVRILPVSARIDCYTVPRCAFSIYTYPDSDDPAVVAIDTVTSDLILTEPVQVASYDQLYERITSVALPSDQSLDLLTSVAAGLIED